jgi:Fe-S-cluster formation regulator IscX/YfhJ
MTIQVYQHYEEVSQANLKQCRRALGSFPQAWTSYSNNRQNAHLYCRAVRSEIEKDDQIHVGKVLAKTAVHASESLHDAFEQFNDLKVEFSKLANAMPQFQMDLAAGNERQLEHVQQFWADLERAREGLLDIATGKQNVCMHFVAFIGRAAAVLILKMIWSSGGKC